MFVLMAAGLISIMHWDWLKDGESGSTTIRNFGLVIAAIVALPLAIWRSIVAERQVATAQRQSETAQRGLLNERYQKGAEMLGSSVPAVRLGGIYALSRLAREHPEDYHTQIMSLLCAFARNPPVVENQDTIRAREDVQAVMGAICARSTSQIEVEKKEYCPLDLSGADLKGVNLFDASLEHWDPRSGKLFRAKMEKVRLNRTNLSGAFLTGANLKGAHFYGANFKGAHLIGADLSGAALKGCEGLTQEQLDQARTSTDTPPDLEGVVDAETGKPLVWRGDSPR